MGPHRGDVDMTDSQDASADETSPRRRVVRRVARPGPGTQPSVTIDVADITTQIASINGFWLTPVDNGDRAGPTTYYSTEIRP